MLRQRKPRERIIQILQIKINKFNSVIIVTTIIRFLRTNLFIIIKTYYDYKIYNIYLNL